MQESHYVSVCVCVWNMENVEYVWNMEPQKMAQKEVEPDGAKGKFHVHTNLQFSGVLFFRLQQSF